MCISDGPKVLGREVPAGAYFVDVHIADKVVNSLIDTGACVTVISEHVFRGLSNVKLESPPEGMQQFEGVVQGSKLKAIGVAHVRIRLGKFLSAPHQVVVVPGTRMECLLGLDFLDKYFISVDTVNRQLKIGDSADDLTYVDVKPKFAPSNSYKVVVSQITELPPRTMIDIPVTVCGLAGDIEGCIEGLDLDNPRFMIGRSINSVTKGQTIIACANVSAEPIVLHPKQKLGMFHPIETSKDILGVQASDGNPSLCQAPMSQLFDLSLTDLTTQQKEQVYALLKRHAGVVGTSELDLGLTETIRHQIIIENTGPIKQRYRRFPDPLRRDIQVEIDKLLERGIIEPSHSAWSSPLVPVRKKNGSLRLCVDYRLVNKFTRKDSYPLPHINDAISKFKDMKYFSSLDLLSGYHQVAMEEDSKEVTAFSNGEDIYQYTRLPFGVTNGPATFSRLVNIVLSGIPLHIAMAYLDDIIVTGSSFEDHFNNLDLVLGRLAEHGLKLSADKCSLFQPEVDYLGHRVGRHGIKPLAKNVQAIVDYPRPKTVRQLRTFNGMCNFYKKFMPKAEVLMKPLNRATSSADKILHWSEECEIAFEQAKKVLAESPILNYPDYSEDSTFYVTCDASGGGAGAVLTQLQGSEEKVIAYAGTSFNETQLRYSPTDRELAAIRFAVNYFKPYLYGQRFIIRTDHQPLIYLHRMKRFDDRLHRTMEDLNIGQFELEYLPGQNNIVADALSRASYPWKLPEDHDTRVCQTTDEPEQGFQTVLIQGGADSFYRALGYLMSKDVAQGNEIREIVVDVIKAKPVRYGYVNSTKGRKMIELLRDSETFPPMGIIQAAADALEVNMVVHFVKGPVITYLANSKPGAEAVHLKCSGGVHFDALIADPPSIEQGINSIQAMQSAGLEIAPLSLNATKQEIKLAQNRDDDIAELVRKVRMSSRGQAVKLTGNLRCYKPKFQKLTLQDGLLVFECPGNKYIPVVPEDSLLPLAVELHAVLSHTGRDKTIAVMYTKFHHPRFSTVITSVVKDCTVCQAHKGKIDRKYPIYRRQVKEPYQMVAVDLMELPISKRHYKYVLVGLDLCTKYAHVVPLKSKKSAVVARAFESRVLASVPRTPRSVLSDNGSEFRGSPFESLLQRYGIAHEYSVPYAAVTNGGVERFNQTLRSRLATTSHGQTRNWDKHLYAVVSQYNRTPHTETGRAPCEFFVKEADINIPSKPYWKAPKNFKPFKAGDLVLRKVPYQPAGERDKLAPRFQGPLKIVEADPNGVVYKAQWLAAPQKVVTVHISQIKAFHGSPEEQNLIEHPEPATKPGVPVLDKEQPSFQDPFALQWDNLKYLPLAEAPEVEAPREAPQANIAEGSFVSGSASEEVLPQAPAEPILPDDQDSDLGNWPMSPEAEDVISDHCEVRTSTPRVQRLPPSVRSSQLVAPQEPTGSCLGRTRQQTRRLQQEAIADELNSRPRSTSSESGHEQFFSDESTEFRDNPGGSGALGISLLAAHSMIEPMNSNSNLIIINNTQDTFKITIENPLSFDSLIKITREDFRWADQQSGDLLPYNDFEPLTPFKNSVLDSSGHVP